MTDRIFIFLNSFFFVSNTNEWYADFDFFSKNYFQCGHSLKNLASPLITSLSTVDGVQFIILAWEYPIHVESFKSETAQL